MHFNRFVSPKKSDPRPMTFGEDVAVKMSQRTLLVILGAVVAVTLAWANLKSEIDKLHEAQASAVMERQADHVILEQVQKGVDSLQRRAEWQDRRDNRSAHNP